MNKYKLIGKLVFIIHKGLNLLTKKEFYYHENVNVNDQNIVVFWHQKIFTTCTSTVVIKKKASITSASNDGEIIAELLRLEGNEVIRGSSNRDNVKSLKETLKYAKKGYTIGIAIDGPKGPIYEPKPGAIFIAQKTGLPILPVNAYTNKKWVLKTWDKLEIPKPFSKNIHYMAEPFYLSKDIPIEEAIEIIKDKLHEAGKKAEEIYNEKYIKN